MNKDEIEKLNSAIADTESAAIRLRRALEDASGRRPIGPFITEHFARDARRYLRSALVTLDTLYPEERM